MESFHEIQRLEWDIVIVGAGVLGCAIAQYLKETNPEESILLVDKFSSEGQGNTVKSNAAFRNIFGIDVNILLSSSSIAYYKELETKGTDLELRDIGYLWLLSQEQFDTQFSTSGSPNNQSSMVDLLDNHSVEYQFLSKSRLQSMLPHLTTDFSEEDLEDASEMYLRLQNISHGFLGKQCGTLSPDLLVRAYKDEFLSLGGSYIFDVEVTDLVLKQRGKEFDEDYIPTTWRDMEIGGLRVNHLNTDQTGILRAKKVVLATGAWINQLLDPLGINSLIKPKKRQLYTMQGFDTLVNSSQFPNPFHSIPFLILPVGGVFLKPVPFTDGIVVGASDDIGRAFDWSKPTNELSMDNEKLDNPRGEMDFYAANILPVLEAYFPTLFDHKTRVEHPSAGMYAYSHDKSPIIEKIQKLGNLYFCSGASGSGIMKADAIGRIAASLVRGDEFATLFTGEKVKVSDFGLSYRNLPKETMVL